VRALFPGSFVTAVLGELDTVTGTYRRINAGHPVELLVRDASTARLPAAPTALPLGLGPMLPRPPAVTEHPLRPGDAIVLYTDGVTEARSADGEQFGLDRLAAFLLGERARGAAPAETMRRLVRTIVSYENGELRDDATAALVQWRPTG
jgi:serine phosphatase RsbU (regulator of sigma subunit)